MQRPNQKHHAKDKCRIATVSLHDSSSTFYPQRRILQVREASGRRKMYGTGSVMLHTNSAYVTTEQVVLLGDVAGVILLTGANVARYWVMPAA